MVSEVNLKKGRYQPDPRFAPLNVKSILGMKSAEVKRELGMRNLPRRKDKRKRKKEKTREESKVKLGKRKAKKKTTRRKDERTKTETDTKIMEENGDLTAEKLNRFQNIF